MSDGWYHVESWSVHLNGWLICCTKHNLYSATIQAEHLAASYPVRIREWTRAGMVVVWQTP